MFIQNNIGEVVNVDQILAVKGYDNAKPYEIHVFTEKTETVFEFDSADKLRDGMTRLERHMIRPCLRWAQCRNWQFRSDKIMSINESAYRDIKVSMVGRDFHIHFDVKDNGEELAEAKKQIADSLSTDQFNSGVIMLDILN
jgi:hypothetical protein